MIKVSQSLINTWRRCQRQYYYKAELKLQKKIKSRPLKFGGIIHKLIESEVKGEDFKDELKKIDKQNQRLFREEREYYGNIVSDIDYIMSAYKKFWAKEPLIYLPKDGKPCELPFEIEIAKGIIFKGTLDGVVRSKKMRWLLEHKTHKFFPSVDHRWRNLQSCAYIRVIEMLGWWSGKVEGVCWDYIRSKPPTRPQLTKTGKLSEREIDSLPEVVKDAIKGYGLDPSQFKALIQDQENRLPNWFQRVYTPTKPKVIDQVFNDLVITAKEIERSQDNKKERPREINQHCEWCEFEALCRASLQGLDESFIREHDYEASDYFKEEDEES